MWFDYINVGLTYFTVGLGCAIMAVFVMRRPILGNFWGALIVGLIGASIGGLLDQLFGDFLARLADFNTVNLFAATFVAMAAILILSRVSNQK